MIESALALTGLVLSAFFSGSEIAFVQANPVQLEVWAKQGRKRARKTSQYLAEPERFLTTVLIGTNLANVLTASYATVSLLRFGLSETTTILIVATVILLFGEIIPKVFFQERANVMAVGVTPLLRAAEIVLVPFVKAVRSYTRIFGPGSRDASFPLSRDDLKVLFLTAGVPAGEQDQAGDRVEEEEKEVISRIFEFGSRPVNQAMTSRSDIVALPVGSAVRDVIQVLSETGLSKLPVYEGSLDTIVGVVFLHDLFARPRSPESVPPMRDPLFVPHTMAASQALEVLKRHNSSIALVRDEDNRTVGLVTVEDLVEEIFGEFEDVFDAEGRRITRLPDGNLVVDSLVEIAELKKRYGFRIPAGDYKTIGGFLLSRLGRIPRPGEMLEFPTFRIKILSAGPARLKRLHLVKKE
ncbi:MAG: hemolysin family protein [Fidelibacterota bacterium]